MDGAEEEAQWESKDKGRGEEAQGKDKEVLLSIYIAFKH